MIAPRRRPTTSITGRSRARARSVKPLVAVNGPRTASGLDSEPVHPAAIPPARHARPPPDPRQGRLRGREVRGEAGPIRCTPARARRHTGPPLRLDVLVDPALDHARGYGLQSRDPVTPLGIAQGPRSANERLSCAGIRAHHKDAARDKRLSAHHARGHHTHPHACLIHTPTSAIRKPTDSPARNGTRVSSIPAGARSIAAATGHDSSMSVMRSRFAASP